MSSNFKDNTNRLISSATTLSPQSVSPRPDFRGNYVVVAQSIPSGRPYSLHGNNLPSHHGPPPQYFDHQILTTSYETQQSLARHFQTDMAIDHNRQRYDMAIMGDVNQQISQPSFSSFPTGSMLVRPETMGTGYGIGESGIPAAYHLASTYRVKNGNTLTYICNPEPQPFFSGAFVNNMQPSSSPSLNTNPALENMQQSLPMGVENPTSANHYQVENTNTNGDGNESSPYSLVADGWRCNFSGCPYVSRSKRDMERHCSNLEHGGSREHGCKFCGKAFVRKDTLKRHVKETRCQLRQAQLTRPSGDLCE